MNSQYRLIELNILEPQFDPYDLRVQKNFKVGKARGKNMHTFPFWDILCKIFLIEERENGEEEEITQAKKRFSP